MHYPHEREERKQLLSALVDQAQKDHFLINICTLFFGFLVIIGAVLHSLFVYPNNATIVIWLAYWTTMFLVGTITIFALPKLLPKEKSRKVYGIKRAFLFKNAFPPSLIGIIIFWTIGSNSTSSLPTAAALIGIFYALIHFSLSNFSLPSVRYLAVACSVISMALLVILRRHNDIPLDLHHLANMMLILNIGIPSVAFGGWNVVIRK